MFTASALSTQVLKTAALEYIQICFHAELYIFSSKKKRQSFIPVKILLSLWAKYSALAAKVLRTESFLAGLVQPRDS